MRLEPLPPVGTVDVRLRRRFANRSCCSVGATPTISIGFESARAGVGAVLQQLSDRILVGEQTCRRAPDR